LKSFRAGEHTSRTPGRHDEKKLLLWRLILVDLHCNSCFMSQTYNFELALGFSKNLYTYDVLGWKYSSTHSYESRRHVHSTPRSPYTLRRSTWFPFSKRLGRPRSRFGRFGYAKSHLRSRKFKINTSILF
jgi:hypothetical protein